MAITSNNVQNVRFLRNGSLYNTRNAAKTALTEFELTAAMDGSVILARYTDSSANTTKTLMGLVYFASESNKSITIFDIDDAGTDAKAYVDSLVGGGVTSANTVTQQLQVLSGDSSTAQSGDTSVEGAKKYTDGKLDALDLATVTEAGKPIIAVKQEDGLVSASAGTINAEFVTYAGTTGHPVTTVEAAIDDIYVTIDNFEDFTDTPVEGQYVSSVRFNDGLPTIGRVALPSASTVSGDSKVVIDVTQNKGAITATAANLTGVKLAGYAEAATTGDVATTDTLGEALGKLQKTIHEMDKNAEAVAGQVVTTVSEADGVVSETKANVKDLQLGGYVKDTTATGDIASADTINAALSKLENKAAAITINDEDGSINVTPTTSGTDISVNIKTGEKVLAKDANGVYTDLDLVKITTGLPETVKERYQLLATDDSQIGVNIDVPKDSHIVSINYITTGEHAQNLEYVYIDASGETQTTYVDMSELVLETEFGSGVTVTDHVAHGVVDPTSEGFLTVGANGFKLSGVQDAIDNAVSGLDATVGSQTVATGKHVAVEVVETDGKLTALTVTEEDIASASALTQEISDRQSGDTALSNRLGDGVTSANTATAQLAALSGNAQSTSAETSVEGAKKYADAKLADVVGDLDATVTDATSGNHVTITIEELDGKLVQSGLTIEENDIASASDLDTEIAARKAVDGVNGNAYTADTTAHYISGASSLYGADQALDTALNAVEGKVDNVAANYISGVTVNGSGVTVSDHVAPIVISASTDASTATTAAAITVDTDANGNITLGLAGIDCGTYN